MVEGPLGMRRESSHSLMKRCRFPCQLSPKLCTKGWLICRYGQENRKLGSGSLRIKAAKKSGFTLLCRKEAVAPPLSTGCLPGNPSTKEHTGHAGEISLAGPRITLLIATFPGISWLKQREGSESGKAGQLDKKGAFSACGLVLPRILSRALCIPGC